MHCSFQLHFLHAAAPAGAPLQRRVIVPDTFANVQQYVDTWVAALYEEAASMCAPPPPPAHCVCEQTIIHQAMADLMQTSDVPRCVVHVKTRTDSLSLLQHSELQHSGAQNYNATGKTLSKFYVIGPCSLARY